jgi:hypothetical protein
VFVKEEGRLMAAILRGDLDLHSVLLRGAIRAGKPLERELTNPPILPHDNRGLIFDQGRINPPN